MAQKVQIEINGKDNVSAPLKGVSGQLETLKARFDAGGPAVGKLNGALTDIGKNMVGLQGNAAKLAQAFLGFGPQGAVIAAAVAGVGLLINQWRNLKQAQEDALTGAVEGAKDISSIASAARGQDIITRQQAAAAAFESAKIQLQEIEDDIEQKQQFIRNLRALGALGRAVPATQLPPGGLQQIPAQILEKQITDLTKQAQILKKGVDDFQDAAKLLSTQEAARIVSAFRELNGTTKISTEQQNQYNKALQTLTDVLNDTNAPINAVLTAKNALSEKTKTVKDTTKSLIEIDKERITVLYALREVDQLNTEQLFELDRLERKYEAILKDGNQTLEQRAEALGLLGPMYQQIAQQQEASRKAGEQWTAGLIKQIEEIKKQSDEQLSATIGVVSRAGNQASGGDVMFLNQALVNLNEQLLNTSDIIEQNALQQKIDAIKNALEEVGKVSYTVSENMTMFGELASNSWELMFSVIGSGGRAMATFGVGFARMVAQMAKTKAAENLAAAIENFAKSAGWIALGNVASSAAAKTAAVGHLKAAAAWGALAGAGIAGGNAIAANNGGAGSFRGFSQSGVGGTQLENQGNVTIIFPDGLIDLSNPATQREFAKLINQVAGNRQINYVGA